MTSTELRLFGYNTILIDLTLYIYVCYFAKPSKCISSNQNFESELSIIYILYFIYYLFDNSLWVATLLNSAQFVIFIDLTDFI